MVSADHMTLSGRWLPRFVLVLALVLGTGVAMPGCCAKAPPAKAEPTGESVGAQAESPAWLDVDGQPHHPLATGNRPATVLLFIATDCPISNAYAPEVGRIVEAYKSDGVGFFAVHADPSVDSERARTHAREFGYPCPVLLDPDQALARHVEATLTPEAAVLDREGRVAYLGRIDNLFAGYGKRRHAPTTRELRDALDAVLAGRAVERPRVAGIGCEIPTPRR